MTTDTLLLKRAMGSAIPEDYVEWAVRLLCDGLDSYHLRILAGLNLRFNRDEVEPYFNKTCKELDIEILPVALGLRYAAGLVKRAYDRGEITVQTALYMMADLFVKSEYSDALLSVWYEIEEELSFRGSRHEGCFYPPKALDSLEETFDREWSLFERASSLDLPINYHRFIRCDKCGHIGESKLRHRAHTDKIRAAVSRFRPKPTLWHTCSVCGSYHYHSMTDPDVRDEYYKRLESEQSLPAGARTSRG